MEEFCHVADLHNAMGGKCMLRLNLKEASDIIVRQKKTCFVIVAESMTKRIPLEPGPYLPIITIDN